MDLELLQLALMVELDHRQVYPALTEVNGIMYVQYNVGRDKLTIDVQMVVLIEPNTYKVIKNKVYEWLGEL